MGSPPPAAGGRRCARCVRGSVVAGTGASERSGRALVPLRWPSEAVMWHRGGSTGAGGMEPLTAELGRTRVTAAWSWDTQNQMLRRAPQAVPLLPCLRTWATQAVTSPPGAAAPTHGHLRSEGSGATEDTSRVLVSPGQICVDERGKILRGPFRAVLVSCVPSCVPRGPSHVHSSVR